MDEEAVGYAAALAPTPKHSLYEIVLTFLPAIIACKAFLNSAPLKDTLIFQFVSPLPDCCSLEVLLDELLFEIDDGALELEYSDEMLLVISSELVVLTILVSLVIMLEDCVSSPQPLITKAKAAKSIGIIFFFIAKLLYTRFINKKRLLCYHNSQFLFG